MRNLTSNIALLQLEFEGLASVPSHLEFCEQQEVIHFLKTQPQEKWPEAIISGPGSDSPSYDELLGYVQGLEKQIPVFIYDTFCRQGCSELAKDLGVTDYFGQTHSIESVLDKVDLHLAIAKTQPQEKPTLVTRKKDLAKRLFDIVVSLSLLIVLAPLFLIVALAIRLESKGKVFYFQPRVGQGYQVFKFFKFRSMLVNADKMVAKLQAENPYGKTEEHNKKASTGEDDIVLWGNEGPVSELEFLRKKSLDDEKAFFKVQNDPRITKVGHFIRKTSIDELPQLVNVLIGDMSIVGNRPLPVYEAEKLTSDEWATRFLAPAGITGLWQVTDRGKKGVSSDSRKRLDADYALNSSFWTDLWILFKTPLAAIQQENV